PGSDGQLTISPGGRDSAGDPLDRSGSANLRSRDHEGNDLGLAFDVLAQFSGISGWSIRHACAAAGGGLYLWASGLLGGSESARARDTHGPRRSEKRSASPCTSGQREAEFGGSGGRAYCFLNFVSRNREPVIRCQTVGCDDF